MVWPKRTRGGTNMPPRTTAPTGVSLDPLEWRQLGPFRGGRVEAVAGGPRGRNTVYFGSGGGRGGENNHRRPLRRHVAGGWLQRAGVWATTGPQAAPRCG